MVKSPQKNYYLLILASIMSDMVNAPTMVTMTTVHTIHTNQPTKLGSLLGDTDGLSNEPEQSSSSNEPEPEIIDINHNSNTDSNTNNESIINTRDGRNNCHPCNCIKNFAEWVATNNDSIESFTLTITIVTSSIISICEIFSSG